MRMVTDWGFLISSMKVYLSSPYERERERERERGGEWYTYRLTTVSTPTSGIHQYTAVWIAAQ